MSMTQSTQKSARKDRIFVLSFLAVLALSLVLVAAINRLVDPYGVFSNQTIDGFNSARMIDNVRIFKTHQIQKEEFDGVILGNSRAEGGIFIDTDFWDAGRIYNFAMPGSTLTEIYRNLQHAHAAHNIKEALVGLDFVMFSAFKEHAKTFSEDYLLVDALGNPTEKSSELRTYAKALLTSDAWKRSMKVYKESRSGGSPSYDESGSFSSHHYEKTIDNYQKFRENFRRFEKTYFKKDGKWLHGPGFKYKSIDPRQDYSSGETYRKILIFCHRNEIALHQFISPMHIRTLYGRKQIGLQQEVNDWKKEIQLLNRRVAESFSRTPFPLWDFSVTNKLTTEPLLPAEHPDASLMKWFQDGVHYTKSFGDLIQSIVFEGRAEPGIAIAMHQGQSESELHAQDLAIDLWAQKNPKEAREIQTRLRDLNTLDWQNSH